MADYNLQPAWKHGAILGAFTLTVTLALAFTYYLTKHRIGENEDQQRQQALYQVLPDGDYDQPIDQHTLELIDEQSGKTRTCYIVHSNKKPTAVIISAAAPDGYAGEIQMLIGLQRNGTISGVRVTNQGLGDAIETRRSDWILNFEGKNLNTDARWRLKKYNGDFDQFTGATITPRAVVAEVKNTLVFFNDVQDQLFNQ